MNTKIILNIKSVRLVFASLLCLCALVFISCSDDDDVIESESYFNIEENPTGIVTDIKGVSKSYTVRSNGAWQIVAQENVDWVKVFPSEGKDDGIFKFTVKENTTFDARSVNFAFIVDGKEQPILFRVDQEANVPFIILQDAADGISIPSAEGNVAIPVKANVDWNYTLENGDWLSEVEVSETKIVLLASKNRGDERSTKLIISSAGYPDLTKEVLITQSSGNVILEENFDWLNYGSTIFYTTSGETRMDSWTADEMARGWNSTVSEDAGNQKVVYARTGFLKLGKTGYGGDLISPALSALTEPTNVKVTFKAVPYKTKGGTEDDNNLKVSVVGPGTTSVNSFTVDNWPDYDEDPDSTDIWLKEESTYEFIIMGATAETQLRFLGGDFNLVGVGKGKNRIFLDDIKVKIIE
ncbi:BACON domain-containing protein [Gelidibacter salicanalis]|uniref:BACON domain-containing protein n=1 Tax=Gelidibacter salicanalis TaxID=291193 RepID=A0A934NDS2_9FLAO|nr:BACON domain-containing protein [Gelidibacter salicanalis]MBJ7881985.1 BACON domain-containing protein [Gelidibacter salicanalis]